MGHTKATTAGRTDQDTLSGVETFIDDMEKRLLGAIILFNKVLILKESHVTAPLLFNADETLLNVTSDSELRCLKMLDPLRKARQSKRIQLNTVGSMTPFVNAAGEVYLIVYCLKALDDKPVEFS